MKRISFLVLISLYSNFAHAGSLGHAARPFDRKSVRAAVENILIALWSMPLDDGFGNGIKLLDSNYDEFTYSNIKKLGEVPGQPLIGPQPSGLLIRVISSDHPSTPDLFHLTVRAETIKSKVQHLMPQEM